MGRSVLFTTDGDLNTEGVYAQALDSRQALDEKLTQLVNAKEKKRKAEFDLVDREMELVSEFRGANPEMSQTQFDKMIKVYINQDPRWRELRDQVHNLTGEVEAADADRSVLKRDIEIAVGRMISNGGQLFYHGADKLAE